MDEDLKTFRIYAIVQAETKELALEDFNENPQCYSFDVEEIETD